MSTIVDGGPLEKTERPKCACDYCGKYISVPNLTTHLKRCPVKHNKLTNDPKSLQEKIQNQTEVIRELKEENISLREQVNTIERLYERLLGEVVVIKK